MKVSARPWSRLSRLCEAIFLGTTQLWEKLNRSVSIPTWIVVTACQNMNLLFHAQLGWHGRKSIIQEIRQQQELYHSRVKRGMAGLQSAIAKLVNIQSWVWIWSKNGLKLDEDTAHGKCHDDHTGRAVRSTVVTADTIELLCYCFETCDSNLIGISRYEGQRQSLCWILLVNPQ